MHTICPVNAGPSVYTCVWAPQLVAAATIAYVAVQPLATPTICCAQPASVYTPTEYEPLGRHRKTPSAAMVKAQSSFLCESCIPVITWEPSTPEMKLTFSRVPLKFASAFVTGFMRTSKMLGPSWPDPSITEPPPEPALPLDPLLCPSLPSPRSREAGPLDAHAAMIT